MGKPITSISIEGFKSIHKLENLELGSLNVLIGANGAGKSNFIDFFRLLHSMAVQGLASFVRKQGGADGLFYLGPKYTPKIRGSLHFGEKEYRFEAEPTVNNELLISDNALESFPGGWALRGASRIHNKNSVQGSHGPPFGDDILSDSTVYHFHDTSELAPVRRDQSFRDFDYLRPRCVQHCRYLLELRKERLPTYEIIRDSIRLIAPFFDDFSLHPEMLGNEENVRLEWNQKGSDFPFQPSHLSDGTLRFICLATALEQPEPPPTILIDEPELGLHPHALEVLAGLLKKAATRTQVIVSTQSASLLSQFNPEDVIVVTRSNEASEFHRMNAEQLAAWLEDYALGELWEKNYLEGASYG